MPDDPIRWEGSVGIRARLRSGSIGLDGNAAMPTPPPNRRLLCAGRLRRTDQKRRRAFAGNDGHIRRPEIERHGRPSIRTAKKDAAAAL